MVGFYAFADSSQPIRIDLDNELAGTSSFPLSRPIPCLPCLTCPFCSADARWFTREEVQAVLGHRDGTTITRREYKRLDEIEGNQNSAGEEKGEEVKEEAPPPFRVPPVTAIAGVLIRDWAEGKIGTGVEKKGNL